MITFKIPANNQMRPKPTAPAGYRKALNQGATRTLSLTRTSIPAPPPPSMPNINPFHLS